MIRSARLSMGRTPRKGRTRDMVTPPDSVADRSAPAAFCGRYRGPVRPDTGISCSMANGRVLVTPRPRPTCRQNHRTSRPPAGGYGVPRSSIDTNIETGLMAQIGDFFARLVRSAGGTRGLSGDADRVLPSEPVFAFFNDRLRKHHTPDDFIVNPSLLWSTQTFLSRRGGLEAHLRAERGDGVAGFDILVVINAHDWRRSLRLLSEPWAAVAAHRLRSQFQVYEGDFFIACSPAPDGGSDRSGWWTRDGRLLARAWSR